MGDTSIHIEVPESFYAERAYVADVIFKEFLGVPFSIDRSEELRNVYVIRIGDKEIEIEDSFFSRCNEQQGYLIPDMIPHHVVSAVNEFTTESDIPLLFGSGKMERAENRIFCGHDIFASVFYMLSRWEEYVIPERDYLKRFPAQSALAYKYDFLHRPVVNEWVEMLKNMIRSLVSGFAFSPSQSFEIVFTHDIDLLNAPVTLKEFAKDVVKRRSAGAIIKRTGYLLKGINPYNVFDYFMDTSERHNSLSRFYFMTGHNLAGRDGEPYNSTPLYKKTLEHIQSRGHIIGFHPSLFSYNNPDMFAKEKLLLEQDIGVTVTEGRQHALRFELPETWSIWEQHGMQMDSTLGYSAKEGFRCGTGNAFTVFDVKKRSHYSLKEMPMIIMDNTLHVNRKLNIDQSKKVIRRYIDVGRKYNMPITLLFHNLIDDSIDWKNWKSLYDDLFANNSDL
jgi:hypothetical protein